jgi:hypothetical protein
MALFIGSILGGPDQINKQFSREMDAIALRIESLQKDLIDSDDGLLNLVFLFSGRVFQPPFTDVRVGRYMKNEKRLEIKIPVAPEIMNSSEFAQHFASMLRQAIHIAKEVFDKKGAPFSLDGHLGLVDQSLDTLTEANHGG